MSVLTWFALAIFYIITVVNARDVCLHCSSIDHPAFCTSVERCQDGEACFIDQHEVGGHVKFTLGCRRQEVCYDKNGVLSHMHHSQADIRNCTQCCHGDLCNVNGCNQTGYRQDRGPICFNCDVMSHPDECDHIAFCGRDQACFLHTNIMFGAKTYSASCAMKTVCNALHTYSSMVGRRDTKQSRHILCTKCCTNNLCNNNCNNSSTHSHCHPNPCTHGSCTEHAGGYSCTCKSGYMGKHCELDIDECVQNPCQHGHCINTDGGFMCTYDQGYVGQLCNKSADPCLSNPCVHGLCHAELDGGHRCICYRGYTGLNCDTDIDECAYMPCLHGTCENTPGGYACHCDTGYANQHCTYALDPCQSNPCVFGHCVKSGNGFFCTCNTGYTGTLCDQAIVPCYPNPCVHGRCFGTDNSFVCMCWTGYTGRYCDHGLASASLTTTPTSTTASLPTTVPSTSECADTVENCAFMSTLQSDFCHASVSYARVHCRKSCHVC